ncbi:hypothetical protein QH494_04360 [Sphingomonas sp. AR_OL41]|jgi:hypothetical protein|uniref:hypothetical protein n=1 Tax=Sphingomonas sp. AR_OL41 TaxID=3042729 RepID=UPI00248186FA|nr:hypothetical protein [Sphingomonas sp. AR_OL41]MDH7971405.1 hypothetical protein [Sphingomonas sp. AR_OL41]
MKRLVMGLGIVLAATGCSSQQTASANSEETIRTTAIANIVAAMPNQTPTPVANETAATGPENGAAPSDLSNMVSNITTQD